MSKSAFGARLRRGIAAAALLLAACTPRLEAPRQYSVYFESDRAVLTPEAEKVVVEIAGDAHRLGPSKIVVAGHADGGTAHDATLADQRASSVLKGLAEHGVAPAMLEKRSDAPTPGRTGVAAHEVIVRFLP